MKNMTTEALEAELADLNRQQAEATGWGAAVGARHEHIQEIEGELRRREKAPGGNIHEMARRMRTAAEKATPGEWRAYHGFVGHEDTDEHEYFSEVLPPESEDELGIAFLNMNLRNGEMCQGKDAEHIAASCPANILALLDDRDRLAAEVAMLREALRDLLDVCIAADPEQSVFPQQMQNAHFALDGLPPPSVMEANTRLKAEVERLREALKLVLEVGLADEDGAGAVEGAIHAALTPAPTSAAPERDERAIEARVLREAADLAARLGEADRDKADLPYDESAGSYDGACDDIATHLRRMAGEREGRQG